MNKISIKDHIGIRWIEVNRIMRFEAHGNCTWIFFYDGTKILQTKTLKNYHDILHGKGFCRVHDKHLINMDSIKTVSKGRGGFVFLKNELHVEISYRHKPFLKQLLKEST